MYWSVRCRLRYESGCFGVCPFLLGEGPEKGGGGFKEQKRAKLRVMVLRAAGKADSSVHKRNNAQTQFIPQLLLYLLSIQIRNKI